MGFKLEKEPTDKAKEPDPGGSDQQNLGYKKTEKQKNWPYSWIELLYFLYNDFLYNSSIQPYGQFFSFSVFRNSSREIQFLNSIQRTQNYS